MSHVQTVRCTLCALFVVGCFALPACSPSVPEPATGSHPAAAFVEVAFPPPAARPEVIPPAPSNDAVWLDGEWRWRRDRWYWVLGRWVDRPEGAAYFARSALRYDAEGKLHHAAGTWRRDDGTALTPARAEDLADTTTGDVVEETGVLEDVGPNRKARRPQRRRPANLPTCEVEGPCPFDKR